MKRSCCKLQFSLCLFLLRSAVLYPLLSLINFGWIKYWKLENVPFSHCLLWPSFPLCVSGVWWPGPDHTYDVSNHTGHNLSSSGRFLLRSLIPSYQAVCCPLASPQNRFPSLYWGRECEGRAKPPGAGSGRRYILFFSRIPIKISFLFGGDFFSINFPIQCAQSDGGTNRSVKNNLTCLTISHVKILIIACFPCPAGLTLSPQSWKISLSS